MATQAAPIQAYTANRRRFHRHKIELQVRVVIPTLEKTRIVSARGTDLNEGGLRVFAGTEMRVGDSIFIEFTPVESVKPVRVAAIVCNREGYHYGVEFHTGNTEQQQHVTEFGALLQPKKSN